MVIKAPGNATQIAERSIPILPPSLFPIPAAISTGNAPGVIVAAKTSCAYSSFVSHFLFVTTSFSNTGINALPPPKPRKPIFNIHCKRPLFHCSSKNTFFVPLLPDGISISSIPVVLLHFLFNKFSCCGSFLFLIFIHDRR